MLDVKFVSDLDYGYNKVSGKFDIPSVEWEGIYGTYWERFNTEEERRLALAQNEAYNSQPEIVAYIEEQRAISDKREATAYTNELFDWAIEENRTVELTHAFLFAGYVNDRTKSYITKLVCTHNKFMLRTRRQPKPATFLLGELF